MEVADDTKVKALYAIMEKEIEGLSIEYSQAFKDELDNRYKKYKIGESETVTAEESMESIKRILKSADDKE